MASRVEEERRALRPYRRLVFAIFAIFVVVSSVLVLRGIVRHLDRLPALAPSETPKKLDARALRACSEDLSRLESTFRKEAGPLFGAPFVSRETALRRWDVLTSQVELERIAIVVRCALNGPPIDRASTHLAEAATRLEDAIREHTLLFQRHVNSSQARARETRRALQRAEHALQNSTP